jgi:hypothetical protein
LENDYAGANRQAMEKFEAYERNKFNFSSEPLLEEKEEVDEE